MVQQMDNWKPTECKLIFLAFDLVPVSVLVWLKGYFSSLVLLEDSGDEDTV